MKLVPNGRVRTNEPEIFSLFRVYLCAVLFFFLKSKWMQFAEAAIQHNICCLLERRLTGSDGENASVRSVYWAALAALTGEALLHIGPFEGICRGESTRRRRLLLHHCASRGFFSFCPHRLYWARLLGA